MTADREEGRDGVFPEPPREFTDRAGRPIRLARAGPEWLDRLAAMYEAFDHGDRAQGIPPARPDAIREWLAAVLTPERFDVVALHGDRPVGHATLVPDDEAGYELAIFVLRAYQDAGIGTALLETLLGLARAADVDSVWLTVERGNAAALAIYEKVGFERTDTQRFGIEMRIHL